jgi:hypothetical protein
VYVEPVADENVLGTDRIETPRADAEWRKRNFAEVEVTLSQTEAKRESHRCLRCDLEFTQEEKKQTETEAGRQSA